MPGGRWDTKLLKSNSQVSTLEFCNTPAAYIQIKHGLNWFPVLKKTRKSERKL